MKRSLQLVCVVICISLLCSCERFKTPKYEKVTEETITEKGNETTIQPDTTVNVTPMVTNSNEKKSHSYGVAKDGKPNEISVNAQKYFDSNKFKAFCLDTKSDKKIMYLTFD